MAALSIRNNVSYKYFFIIYRKPRQGTMTPKDYKRAKQYAEKAKQQYIYRKNDKKK